MKKIILLTLASVVLSSGIVFAAGNKLMDIRNKLLVESQEIRDLSLQTKDVILVNSMWNSSAMAISQLDAYFSELGIFNTIKKEEVTGTAINFLINWLKEIKETNDVNIKSLSSITQNIEPQTKLHLERLKGYYADMNDRIEKEFVKLDALKKVWVQK
jgi:hypothetical protein